MNNEFSELGLQPELVQQLTELGYETPTPIQKEAIPLLLEGWDIIGQAQTGTGKTAAFALPLLQKLTNPTKLPKAIVLAPTRELAIQVSESISNYGRIQKTRVVTVYGGQSYNIQIRPLKKGVDVVVGTPGRIIDLIKQGYIDLSAIETVVLDEADEMLSMGFVDDIETILAEVPIVHQTALFSATVPKRIRQLADKYMNNPKQVAVKASQQTIDLIEQRYYLVNQRDKIAAVTRIFEIEKIETALIFAKTRASTGSLASELTSRGFSAEALNGDLSQDARERVLQRFSDSKMQVLVATDIAARGLDIDHISHVFNFDLPQFPDVFVHRVGRTGRAGKTGVAITLITPKEKWMLRRIESHINQKLIESTVPTREEIETHRETQLVEKMMVWLRRGRCKKERETVDALVAEGVDPIEIAAAALKLARSEEKQRPISHVSSVSSNSYNNDRNRGRRSNGNSNGNWGRSNRRDSKRNNSSRNGSSRNNDSSSNGHRRSSHESGMIRLSLSSGRNDGIRPNDVVGTIAYHAQIPGHVIGAIKINEHSTLVDIPEQFVTQVLQKNGNYQIRRQNIEIEKA